MLPDMDGYTILSKIREVDKKIPVIIVSAKSDEISFVKGLKKGSDDYMSKPFSVLELIARVKTNIFYHRRRAFRRKRLWYRDDRYGLYSANKNKRTIHYNIRLGYCSGLCFLWRE